MDKALNLLGLMKKSNRITLTEKSCREDIISGRSKLVLTASDGSTRTIDKIRKLAEAKEIKCIDAGYTKDELAAAMGSGLCSVISINDGGFADAWLNVNKN